MKHSRLLGVALSLGLMGLALLPGASAAPLSITLPPETAELRHSDLPGYALALQKCGICHSAEYINYQPPTLTPAQWSAEVKKMQHVYGAPISDEELPVLAAYLASTYGAAPPPAATTTANPATTVAMAAPASDAPSLLNANGCLGCHATDKKIVGPAYHEVAAHYKDDPQALATVMANIQSGGSGRWGTVPMPPFAQLSQEQLKTLAEFVLKQ